jgi:pimeloyl-ACP methyl ester carboxylesterase
LPVYARGERNILFVVKSLEERYPEVDVSQLTLVGHSNGGDISVYFASQWPHLVARLATFDNLRVPLPQDNRMRILTVRSFDWKADAGVVPSDELCIEVGIDLVKSDFQHVDMSDRGPEIVKQAIALALEKFLRKPPLIPGRQNTAPAVAVTNPITQTQ